MTWADLAFGAALALGTGAAVWFVATLLEASLWLGTTARTALAAAMGTVAVGVAAAALGRPLGRLLGLLPGPSDEAVARQVGRHHPAVADRLVNLLQLAEGKRSHAPTPFIDQAVQQLAADLDEVSFREVEDFGRARQAARLASLPLAAVLAFLLLAPSTFLNASERLLAPATAFDRPAPFELSVRPGGARLVRGDSLQITVEATGETPSSITLVRRDSSASGADRITLRADGDDTFRHTLPALRESFQYRVAAAPVRTPWYEVTVAARPLVRRLQVTVTPPAYTGLPARDLEPNVGDVSALPGATVAVSAALGGPPTRTARIVFDDSTTRSLTVEDGTARGAFGLRREGTYRVRLESRSGVPNRAPIRYQLSLQSDARPSVRFLAPTGPTPLGDDLTQRLRVQLSDDHGFTRAALFYRVADQRFGEGEAEYDSLPLPLAAPGRADQTLTHEWLLAQETGLDPEPGDVIAYYVKAWDNDTVNGPKSGRTATQRLRKPSLTEQYEALDETQTDADRQMDRLRQRADSARQQFRQLREELRRTREADWQDRRQLQRLRQKQQSLDQGVQKLSKTVRKMTRQMQRNDLSSPEVTKQFQELQRVIDEIDSPELRKALDQLRKGMQNDNLRQMQQSMEQVQKKQGDYQKQLDRALSLFKQLKAQQKLEEMSRRAGELSETEKTLREKTTERMEEATRSSDTEPSADSAGADARQRPAADSTTTGADPGRTQDRRADPSRADSASTASSSRPRPDSSAARRPSGREANEDLASEQDRAAEKMKQLQEALEKAQQELSDVSSAPKKQMQKLNRQLRKQNLPRQMRQNSQQLRQNQLRDAQQGQQRMQQSLQQMEKQLSQMKSQMQGRQRQINLAGLRTALDKTLRLSQRQEALRSTVEALASDGPGVRAYAPDQKVLSSGLKAVTDTLTALAEQVPEMTRKVQATSGRALRAMETATTALDERRAGEAAGHQKSSMMHLNELALLLSNLLEQMQNQQQGSGSGMSMQQMMQKLQQMSGQQQKLNRQIQQQLNNAQGQRLSSEQAERRKELARQQRRLKQQLQNMDVGSEARSKILGDLQKIAEQMEESARDLEQSRRPSRDLIERQQQILTRLLNAQNSLRTQGKKEQRQGRSSTDAFDRQPPGALPPAEEADRLRRDLIRALEMGYSSDYETLIRRYFELLRTSPSEEVP
jgi:hypothetical protein